MEQHSRAEIKEKSVEVFGEIYDVVEVGEDTSEEGIIELDLGTGEVPIHEIGGGSVFEDYPGDSFEKVREIDPEKEPKQSQSLFPPSPLKKP